MTARRCRCGHDRDAHEHYRSGSDCAICGPQVCARYHRDGGLWQRLAGALRPGRAGPST